MYNILFATAAIGEKYTTRCLETLKSFNKLDYDHNDEVVVVTDKPSVFDDVQLPLKLTILPYYLPKEWPVVNAENFRDNTLIKTIIIGETLMRDNSHELYVWYDCDSFIHKTKESMQKYNDDAFVPGFYYKDAHKIEANVDSLSAHHLWNRGERYLGDLNVFTSVFGTREIEIHQEEGRYIFPIETNFIIKRNLSDPLYLAKECAFNTCASELTNFCLVNFLNDNYGESFELNLLISKSFKHMQQAPVIPAYCDLHMMPYHDIEKDKEAMMSDDMFKEFIFQ